MCKGNVEREQDCRWRMDGDISLAEMQLFNQPVEVVIPRKAKIINIPQSARPTSHHQSPHSRHPLDSHGRCSSFSVSSSV